MQDQKSSVRHIAIYGTDKGRGKRWELPIDENNPYDIKALKLACLNPPANRYVRYNPFPNVVLGDWHDDIGKVDWDERFLCEVKRFSKIMVKRFPRLGGGFIILQSSTKLHKIRDESLDKIAYTYKSKSYHTVFNGKVSYNELDSMLAWLCLFTKDMKLITWFLLQLIKGTYTLRLGFKGRKRPPKIVCCYGSQDGQIKKFLETYVFVQNFLRENEREIAK